MNTNKRILVILAHYLLLNPDIRFGQALFNLGINSFVNQENPEEANHHLRDIYNDLDEEILNRIHAKGFMNW